MLSPWDQEQGKMSIFATFIQLCTWGSTHGIRQENKIKSIHPVKEEVKWYLFAVKTWFLYVENPKEPTKQQKQNLELSDCDKDAKHIIKIYKWTIFLYTSDIQSKWN